MTTFTKAEIETAWQKKAGRRSSQDWDAIGQGLKAKEIERKQLAVKGRKYSSETVANLAKSGHEVLMNWLEEMGAPEEILTLAKWVPTAENIKTRYFWEWNKIDEYAAADVARLIPEMREAIKVLKAPLPAESVTSSQTENESGQDPEDIGIPVDPMSLFAPAKS
jgi:hypothetical protein